MSKKELIQEALHLIDGWLDYQVYIKELPGISVGIVFEDETIFRKEYGYANLETKEKLTSEHMFRIASHSKLFTATAIMKLYSEDKLSTDDRVSKHLPWFSSKKDEILDQIRISHLMTHASGITRDGDTGHWIKLKFPEIEEIKQQVSNGVSIFEPSTFLKYSNFAYTILGQIIESVSGLNYEEYIQKEILDPLGMTKTSPDVYDSNKQSHAVGHKRRLPRQSRGLFPQVNAGVMHAATGFSSTVDDLIKFCKGHMMGNDILFPDHVKREMQRIQFIQDEDKRGFGFGTMKWGDLVVVGHSGGYPGFITDTRMNQEHKMIISVLTNAVDGPAMALTGGVGRIIDYILKNESKLTTPEEINILDVDQIIGYYASDWGTSFYSKISEKLVSIAPGMDNPVTELQVFSHQGDHVFKTPDKPMGNPGQTFKFIDGPTGEKQMEVAPGAVIERFSFSY